MINGLLIGQRPYSILWVWVTVIMLYRSTEILLWILTFYIHNRWQCVVKQYLHVDWRLYNCSDKFYQDLCSGNCWCDSEQKLTLLRIRQSQGITIGRCVLQWLKPTKDNFSCPVFILIPSVFDDYLVKCHYNLIDHQSKDAYFFFHGELTSEPHA